MTDDPFSDLPGPLRRRLGLDHPIDLLGSDLDRLAERFTAYRKKLIDGGMTEIEAFELVLRLEERIMGELEERQDD